MDLEKKKLKRSRTPRYLLLALLGGYLVFVVSTGRCPACFIPGFGPQQASQIENSEFRLHESGWVFEALDGTMIAATDLQGMVVVVNYWATWCGPCRRELPAFNRVAASSAEARFIGISVDRNHEDLVRFLESSPLEYPVVHADRRFEVIAGPIRSIPTTLIFDRDGILRERVVGMISESALRRHISKN